MTVEHLYISPGHNFYGHHGKPPGDNPVVEVGSVECVEGKGLKGDRFYDYKEDYKGQVTFFAAEVYENLCEQLQVTDKTPAAFRRNVIVRGGDLNALIGREFSLGDARFLGTEEARPCYWMEEAFGEGAEEALRGNGGLRAKILATGTLRTGDTGA